MKAKPSRYIIAYLILNFDVQVVLNGKAVKRVLLGHFWPNAPPNGNTVNNAYRGSGGSKRPTTAMKSLGSASRDLGSPTRRVGSSSGHGRSPTAQKPRGELSEDSRNDLAIRCAMKLPPGRKRLPEGESTTLAEAFKVSKKGVPCDETVGSINIQHKSHIQK